MFQAEINEVIEEYPGSFNYGRYLDGKKFKMYWLRKATDYTISSMNGLWIIEMAGGKII